MKSAIRLMSIATMLVCAASCFASAPLAENNVTLKTYLDKFLSISCDKTGNLCVAVGFDNAPYASNRLVYTTQDAGVTWSSPISLNAPKNEAASTSSANEPHPAKVKCDAYRQRCVIVSATMLENIPTPIVYNSQDGGLTWSEPTVLPLPKTVDKKQKYDYPSAIFSTLSCDYSGFNCLIAGRLDNNDAIFSFLYATHDAGHKWSLMTNLKNISAFPGTALHGVSCDSSGFFCSVVGSAVIKNSVFGASYSARPIVYITEDGGAHWKNPVVLPTEIKATNASTLTDVACSNVGRQCTAIGYTFDYKTNLYQHFSFTTANGGLNWDTGVLITSNNVGSSLHTLSCDETATNCAAIGWYNTVVTGHKVYKPWVYHTMDGAKKWEINKDTSFPLLSELSDVFCSDTGESCILVGIVVDLNNMSGLRAHKKQFIS